MFIIFYYFINIQIFSPPLNASGDYLLVQFFKILQLIYLLLGDLRIDEIQVAGSHLNKRKSSTDTSQSSHTRIWRYH